MNQPPDLRMLVADAVRAPSSHNSQPWRFRLTDAGIDLYADRTRRLPVNDPHDRELVISCGAALASVEITARHHGWRPSVDLQPSDERDHLAHIALDRADAAAPGELWDAIPARRTHRKAFLDRPVDEHLVARAVAAATRPGVWVEILTVDQRTALAELVAAGDQLQFGDRAWRCELAAWLRRRRRGDGLVVPAVAAAVTRLVVRHVDLGRRTGAADRALAVAAPVLVVIGTEHDDPAAWLRAGQSLQQLLLTAAQEGVQAGHLNQPCQVESLRPRLAELVNRPHPQVVLRLGHPAREPRLSPRRPLDEVIDDGRRRHRPRAVPSDQRSAARRRPR